jgi:predicted nucleic acid-binding protein
VYVDTAYLVKYYVNEVDSPRVRSLLFTGHSLTSSSWAMNEVTCVFQRDVREGILSANQAHVLHDEFLMHVETGVWRMIPVTDRLVRRCSMQVRGLSAGVYVRAGDAIHLTTAGDEGETEIWTNDRHLLAAASYFGLTGRSV